MHWPLLLALLPLLPGAAGAASKAFEARGVSGPRWKLHVEGGVVRLDRAQYPRQKRDTGRIDKVERTSGQFRISAMIEIYEIHPLGGKARDGNPMVLVESSEQPLWIEVTEAPCIDASGRSFPTRVSITDKDDQQLRGCGDALAALEAGLTVK